jgi:hypothetical protein
MSRQGVFNHYAKGIFNGREEEESAASQKDVGFSC